MNVEKVFFKLLFLGASGSNAYIASQGPLPHTVNDFWRMVVEHNVATMVMLTGQDSESWQYWPNDDGDTSHQDC